MKTVFFILSLVVLIVWDYSGDVWVSGTDEVVVAYQGPYHAHKEFVTNYFKNFKCPPKKGDPFVCNETYPTAKYCVFGRRGSGILCSGCRIQYEICAHEVMIDEKSTRCSPNVSSTECTFNNTDVPLVM
ncbi:schistosomin-like [Biomphalaria glabrata]|uniref:Schistosomin-like n=1 Tax=Biomphalaria glabrata TaxID=6526 RepID=A0A9W3AQA8_BIOGL|nr:schistosomin-like [Biomphalaria glabrata]